MNRITGGLVCWMLAMMLAGGQVPGGVPVAGEAAGLTVVGLENRLAEVSKEEGLDEEVRTALKEKIGLAVALLKKRTADLAQGKAYSDAVANAADDLAKLATQSEEVAVPKDVGVLVLAEEEALENAEFKALLVREESELGSLRSATMALETAVSNEKVRPEQIRGEVQAALEELQASSADIVKFKDAALGTKLEGERIHATARKSAAQAVIDKLEQEQVSSGQRLKVLQAELALANARVVRGLARVKVLEKVQASRLDAQIEAATREADQASQAGGGEGTALQGHAGEVKELSAELKKVADQIRAIEVEEDAAEALLAELQREQTLVDQQIEIGGGRGAFAQMLVEQKRALPDHAEYRRRLVERQEEITEVRSATFQVEKKIRDHDKLLETAEKESAGVREKVLALLETRQKLLVQLEEEYRRLTRKLGQLDLVERQTLSEVKEFRAVLEEALFWVPSSPKVGMQTARDLPEAVAWLLRPTRLNELGKGIMSAVKNAPFRSVVLVAFLVAGFFLRPRFRRDIASHRVEIRRVSSDRYGYTTQGMGMVLLLSAPLPLLLWFLGRGLAVEVDGSDWLQGTGLWLEELALLVFALQFIRELCREEGLGDVHFGWTAPGRTKVRRDLALISLVYFPAMWIVMAVVEEDSGRMVDSLGRLTYVVAMLWMAFVISHLVRPRDGIFRGLIAKNPNGTLARLRYVWYVVLVGMPIALAGLACMGYLFTAFELTVRFAGTIGIVGSAYLLYWMLLRWFVIRERRTALAQLQKTREAKRKAQTAAAKEGDGVAVAAEEASIPEFDEEAVDLVQVGVQTRHLLRLLVGCVSLIGIWFVWAEAMPVLRYLDAKPILWGATVADFLLGAVILVATIVLAKNLPGILEIVVLSNLVGDAGSRYAIGALVQYGIIAVGFVATFEAVGMDWSQFGWMAAALGVGLGFGLQEIVANFVSGIILLFERPIRVGDVVTVGGTSGVVSRIRIRATTITDWDRKEYVVPNKEFITGRLLNWTLTNKVNRVVVKVGVAYGTDTEKARALLLEIVKAHPAVMDDPGPGVTLDNFGDSSLDFTVRCYLPDLDRRLATTHELHTQIHERFGKEGIEIPFPQRDLNIRSGGGEVE